MIVWHYYIEIEREEWNEKKTESIMIFFQKSKISSYWISYNFYKIYVKNIVSCY